MNCENMSMACEQCNKTDCRGCKTPPDCCKKCKNKDGSPSSCRLKYFGK